MVTANQTVNFERQFQNNYYLVQEGTLEKKVLNSMTNNMTLVKGTPGFKKYWELRKRLFDPEFKMYIHKLMIDSQIQENKIYKSEHLPSRT